MRALCLSLLLFVLSCTDSHPECTTMGDCPALGILCKKYGPCPINTCTDGKCLAVERAGAGGACGPGTPGCGLALACVNAPDGGVCQPDDIDAGVP
jgi:hypothetical protein